jgi:hypothetical protein
MLIQNLPGATDKNYICQDGLKADVQTEYPACITGEPLHHNDTMMMMMMTNDDDDNDSDNNNTIQLKILSAIIIILIVP